MLFYSDCMKGVSFFLYSISMRLYNAGLWAASFFHPKAQKWIAGRANWRAHLRQQIQERGESGGWLWVHCASLGEFEQGRNLIEAIRQEAKTNSALPQKILVTFFSPSGYEIRKNYAHADIVAYLPLDTAANARDFLDIVQPSCAVFVKYDLWLHYLRALRHRQIHTLLISARMDKDSGFLRLPFRELYREAFAGMAAIFTQDEPTAQLLRTFSHNPNIHPSGDTRYDRVAANRAEWKAVDAAQLFIGERTCVVCGSTWQVDEEMLFASMEKLRAAGMTNICFVVAPHEINQSRMAAWEAKFPARVARFSAGDFSPLRDVLFIDNIGMLSRLYAYADVAYVGGGFGSGLHNILEAAVYGCPVLYGNKVRKFPEAVALQTAGGGRILSDANELHTALQQLLSDDALRANMGSAAQNFIQTQTGATAQIMTWLRAHVASS